VLLTPARKGNACNTTSNHNRILALLLIAFPSLRHQHQAPCKTPHPGQESRHMSAIKSRCGSLERWEYSYIDLNVFLQWKLLYIPYFQVIKSLTRGYYNHNQDCTNRNIRTRSSKKQSPTSNIVKSNSFKPSTGLSS
jgi:hypothetical protein